MNNINFNKKFLGKVGTNQLEFIATKADCGEQWAVYVNLQHYYATSSIVVMDWDPAVIMVHGAKVDKSVAVALFPNLDANLYRR